MKKISIVGAGQVGTLVALRVAEKDLADVVLLDIVEGIPQGRALDLKQSAHISGFSVNITGTNDYSDITGSEVVVVTAGFPRTPDMSREDLIEKNAGIIKEISLKIKELAPDSKVIIVTNPLDIMVYLAMKTTGFPQDRVFGMSGVLDSARFADCIADHLKVPVNSVNAMVLGAHGDTMVPISSHATVNGEKITNLMNDEQINKTIEETRKASLKILQHLKTGSTSFAPSAAIAKMIEAILKDKKEVLPVSAYLNGEYGFSDVCVGVPARLGRNGIGEIIELDMTGEEKKQFADSVESVKELIQKLEV